MPMTEFPSTPLAILGMALAVAWAIIALIRERARRAAEIEEVGREIQRCFEAARMKEVKDAVHGNDLGRLGDAMSARPRLRDDDKA